ncbi:MAG: hypothetical protein KIT83_22425, partial [Bryobacterales bacterium]|nr:hypothetical protein [Bryobacterales bacterium]
MTNDTLRFTNSDTNSETIPDEPSDNGQPTTDNPCLGANPQSLDPNPSPFPADNGEPTTDNSSASPG